MQAAAIVTFVYAVLLAVGGIMGGRTGSSVSIYMGIGSGVLAAVAGVLMLQGARPGLYLGLALAIALAAFGGYHFLTQGAAFMPRGLIFVLSVIVLIVLAAVLAGVMRGPSADV